MLFIRKVIGKTYQLQASFCFLLILTKVFIRLIRNVMFQCFLDNIIISPNQSGFKSGDSWINQLIPIICQGLIYNNTKVLLNHQNSVECFLIFPEYLIKCYTNPQSTKTKTCVKSVKIRSFCWFVFSCIRIEYRKIRTRRNSVFGHFSRTSQFLLIENPNNATEELCNDVGQISKSIFQWKMSVDLST